MCGHVPGDGNTGGCHLPHHLYGALPVLPVCIPGKVFTVKHASRVDRLLCVYVRGCQCNMGQQATETITHDAINDVPTAVRSFLRQCHGNMLHHRDVLVHNMGPTT